MNKPVPLPYSYLVPGYGLTHPIIDGLLIARELIEHHIPDSIQYEDREGDWIKEHNDYKDKVLQQLDRRIEQIKIHVNLHKS